MMSITAEQYTELCRLLNAYGSAERMWANGLAPTDAPMDARSVLVGRLAELTDWSTAPVPVGKDA